MAFWDFLKSKEKIEQQQRQRAELLNDHAQFAQFGENIYASDVVQNCIDVIATECSKLQPKHIKIKPNGEQSISKSSINALFKVAPNTLMTTRDFLEKIIWILFLNYNCFIYPEYETYKDSENRTRKRFVGFWPLNPHQVDFEQNENNELFVHMYFKNGGDYTLPYSEVIHLRKKFSTSEIMGGGVNGQPDNAALLKVLEVNNIVLQGIGKAVSTSLAIRGIIKINTMLDDESKVEERKKFEAALQNGEAGILPIDLKGEFTPITVNPKAIDKDTMDFLDKKVLRWFGVSYKVIMTEFKDDEYQAFYEKTLEPLIISLGQAFTKTLFTTREIQFGNEIVFYQKDMMYLSTNSKIQLLKTAGEQGLLKDDQKLALLGYPPIGGEEGNRRTQSLNYVDTNMINEYQAAKSKAPQVNLDGGTGNE